MAADSEGRAALALRMVGKGRDPMAGARANGLREEVVRELERLQIGGLPAARVVADSGGARLHLTWIAHDEHVYRIAGVSRAGDFERFRQAFAQSADSFRPLGDADRRRVTVVRLRTATAREGESLTAVIRRAGAVWSAEQTAISNGIAVNSLLEPGWPVKVPVQRDLPRFARLIHALRFRSAPCGIACRACGPTWGSTRGRRPVTARRGTVILLALAAG